METVKTYINAACDAHHLNNINVVVSVRKPDGEIIDLSDLVSNKNFQQTGGMSPIFNTEIEAAQINLKHNAIPYLHDMWDETPHIELVLRYDQVDAIYELNNRYICTSNNYIDVNIVHWFKLADLIQNLEDYYHKQEQLIVFKEGPQLVKVCQNTNEAHFLLGSISDNKCYHHGYEKIDCVDTQLRNTCDPIWSEIRCDYFDEETSCWHIDGWETDDENSEGTTIAKIYDNRVEYMYRQAVNDTNVQELIDDIRRKEYLKPSKHCVTWDDLSKPFVYNKKLEYIKQYTQEEIDYHFASRAERDDTDEFMNEITNAYQCIKALCDCAMAFKEITNQEASQCIDIFYDAFGDQIMR